MIFDEIKIIMKYWKTFFHRAHRIHRIHRIHRELF